MKYAMIVVATMLIGAGSPPTERVVSGDATIPVTVAGRALRLRAEPSVPGLPLIAPAVARELKLKGGGMFAFGVCYRVGREATCGATQTVPVALAGTKADKRRVGWMSRAYTPAADGSIGPGGLPDPVVRFELHSARRNEQVLTLPIADHGGLGGALFGSWFVLDAELAIVDTRVRMRFDPYRPVTLVTAPVAVALARAYGGTMTRETGRQEIAFGIERPYRIMALARPLMLGGIALTRLGVRVTDEDVAGRISEAGAATAEPDPDEVVVTAKAKKPRPGLIILGADALAGCSTLTFDKPAKAVRLSCETAP